MLWYEMTGKDSDVVVSSRIRLARNLVDYPFGKRLDAASAKEICDKVHKVFENESEYTYEEQSSRDRASRLADYERHIVSREFAQSASPCALIRSDEKQIYIMVNEEDHLRIQSIKAGFALKEAYTAARSADKLIDSSLKIAYDEKLGYLTHCPTNLGTGMRASLMMFLPALTSAGGIRTLQNQLGKLGLTLRGMSGEGSNGDGCLYQISNQITLGSTEEEIITKLSEVCERIIDQERKLRERLRDDVSGRSTDRIMRSYGTMLYAVLIDSEEMMRLYSDVRLAACLKMIDNVTPNMLDRILISGMPAVLTSTGPSDPAARDRARAEMIRRVLSGTDKA